MHKLCSLYLDYLFYIRTQESVKRHSKTGTQYTFNETLRILRNQRLLNPSTVHIFVVLWGSMDM